MQKTKKFELEFIKKRKESRDAFSFYFNWPNEDFDFIPGQYLKVYLDIENVDERGSNRYFTISSSPEEKKYITITTRIIRSSFKKKLYDLKKGDIISAFGPIGYFDFNPKSKLKKVFLAGGIGITPFNSIIKTLEISKNIKSSTIYLFAFFSKKEDVVFYDELKKLEKKNSNLKIVYLLTNEIDPNFENSRLSEKLLRKHLGDYKTVNYFVTGSEKTVNSMFEKLVGIGVSEENILKEDFPGY